MIGCDWTWVKCYGWYQHYDEKTGHTEKDDDFCEEFKYEWRASRKMDDEHLAREVWNYAESMKGDTFDYDNQVETRVLSYLEVDSIDHVDDELKPIVFTVDSRKYPSYPDDVDR